MGRASRRKAQRFGGGLPRNEMTRVGFFPATVAELGRQRQDFMAGTVFAAGAGIAFPQGASAGELPPLFTVYLNDDDSTYGPAPQLRALFELLDEHGALALHQMTTVGTSWSAIAGPEPMVKLKLEVLEPEAVRGKVEILLLADRYAQQWRHIVGGGLIALTTRERMDRASSRPGATFADGMEAGALVAIGSSSVLEALISTQGWPGA